MAWIAENWFQRREKASIELISVDFPFKNYKAKKKKKNKKHKTNRIDKPVQKNFLAELQRAGK